MKKIAIFVLFVVVVGAILWLELREDRMHNSQSATHGVAVDARGTANESQEEKTENFQAEPQQASREVSDSSGSKRLASENEVWIDLEKETKPKASQATRRLGEYEIIQAQRRKSTEGNDLRRYLVEVDGKYSRIVLTQEFAEGNDDSGASPIREVAYVADHVMVELSDPVRFASQLSSLSLEVVKKVPGSSVYLVGASGTGGGIETVDNLIGTLAQVSEELTTEPDYLLFTSELREGSFDQDGGQRGLVPVDGKDLFIDTETHSLVGGDFQSHSYSSGYSPAAYKRKRDEMLSLLPAGARVLTFDPPDGRIGSFRPEVRMHNFVIKTEAMLVNPFTSVFVQNAPTSGTPNNGTNYLRILSADDGAVIRHKDNLPFDAVSIDLSEYATTFSRPQTINVVGEKSDGSIVNQSFRTDGVIDGSGPLDDFETFHFNSSFTDIASLTLSNPPFQIDNIVVLLKGQESPLPEPPELPVIYDVNWDYEPHNVDDITSVGGPYSPSSINFGSAYVRSSFPNLNDQPLELTGEGTEDLSLHYSQLRFDLAREASRYEVEFDVSRTQSDPLTFFFDGAGGLVRFDIQNFISTTATEATHFVMTADLISGKFTMSSSSGGLRTVTLQNPNDVSYFRISMTDNGLDGGIAIDNLVVRAYGLDEPPPGVPLIRTSPDNVLDFSGIPAGTQRLAALKILNEGTEDLVVNSLSSNSSTFVVVESGPFTILPGGSKDVSLRYSPTSVGDHTATLSIDSNDPDTPVKIVTMQGRSTGIPAVVVEPTILDASVVAGTVGTETYRISNTGLGPLEWRMISVEQGGGIPEPATVNDSYISSCWGLNVTEEAGTDAARAWNLTAGSHKVLVAVIDTGVDLNHPDLAANIVANPGEIPGNNIDDDNNGFVDDLWGWDFSGDDNDPDDGNGHGSHVAGTISAKGDNGIGVAGVAWNGGILPIQFLSAQGSGYTSDAIASVNYARNRGAQLINASWGGGGGSTMLRSAIDSFCRERDGLFVAAAGNSSRNTDSAPAYPASFDLDGIISVAASDRRDELANFSNYGISSVDLAAPGDGILSTYRNGGYRILRGTSMAAPHVAGACALVMERNPEAGKDELRYFLLDWVDLTSGMNGRVASRGRLNAYQALKRVPDSWLDPLESGGTVFSGESHDLSLEVDATLLSPGLYTAQLGFSTNDPANPLVNLPINVRVFPHTGYNQWRRQNFSDNNLLQTVNQAEWGDETDGDYDGLSTIAEFLLSTDYDKSDATDSIGVISGSTSQFVFTTRADHDGVRYEVCWSTTLAPGSWRSDQLDVQPLSTDAVNGTVTYGVTCLAPDTDTCFFKLLISEDAP